MEIVENIWITLHELAPWLLFGTIVSALVHKLLPQNFISKQLQGKLGVIKAVVLGIPLPLCSCGVIPTGIGLKKDGSSDGAAIGFMISTPQTGIDSILVSAVFLGWPFAIFKVFAAALTGAIGGFIIEFSRKATDPVIQPVAKSNALPSWKDAWEHGLQLLRSIWKWLIVGILLSAVINTTIQAEDLSDFQHWGDLGAAAAALLISIPLYVCATASIPIAAALVTSGFPLGAALIFLMAGPATNIATIGTIRQEFGTRVVCIYLSTVILGSLVLGLGFDFLLESTPSNHAHEHGHTWWSTLSVYALLVVFLFFTYEIVQQKRKTSIPLSSDQQVFAIEGLHCGGCVRKLEKKLLDTPEIKQASVSLENNQATVESQLSSNEIKGIIEGAGFKAS